LKTALPAFLGIPTAVRALLFFFGHYPTDYLKQNQSRMSGLNTVLLTYKPNRPMLADIASENPLRESIAVKVGFKKHFAV